MNLQNPGEEKSTFASHPRIAHKADSDQEKLAKLAVNAPKIAMVGRSPGTPIHMMRRSPRETRKLVIMAEIRRMIALGTSREEIMTCLGLSERSYYRFLNLTFKHDMELLKAQDVDMLASEIATLKARLTDIVRRCTTMAEDQQVPPRTRLEIEKVLAEVSLAIVKLQIEGPVIIRDVCSRIA